jgi:cysteine desulfurase / selenocysteine lyase
MDFGADGLLLTPHPPGTRRFLAPGATMDLAEFRRHFPIASKHVYLNTAAVGPLADLVLDAAVNAMTEQAAHGSGIFAPYETALERSRVKVARLIGSNPDEIAFVRNTVEALSIVASGLSWHAGDNVVASALEFSGNAYPWLNLASRGVSCRFVPSRNGAVDVDALIEAADERTRVITVSLVQFSNGFLVDLEDLGSICRSKGIRLMVDGIQGVGVVPLNVKDSAVDFLACGAHKWLCSPSGVGFLYVCNERLPEIALTEIGHRSVVPVPGSFTDYRLTLRPDARRLEAGITSYANIAGLEASLDLIDRVGVPRICGHIRGLTTRLIERLRARGYVTKSTQPPDESAGIVSFVHPDREADAIGVRLAAEGIIVSVREGALRVSAHGFNTPDEIDALIAALP